MKNQKQDTPLLIDDLEQTWFQVPNVFFDLIQYLSQDEIKIMMYAFSRTYGFQRGNYLTLDDFISRMGSFMTKEQIVSGIRDSVKHNLLSRKVESGIEKYCAKIKSSEEY